MKSIRTVAIAAMLCLLAAPELLAQFPVTLQLPAGSGQPVRTPPTRPDARYRITVTGTYSQWPQFTDCHGVDGVWVYDVPKEEIDAYRWPPKTVLGRPFVEIPHWVGDSTRYGFPPSGLGLPALFEISFRKYLGFRVNDEPLPPMPFDPVFHRYQHVLSGTGQELSFSIRDSTYNVAQGAVIPRYEDNCGGLTVVVEEILPNDVNICDAKVISQNGQAVGLRIDASIVEQDTNMLSGTRNAFLNKEQLGVVADGKFICSDSLVCDTSRTVPISLCLVVDVSSSMLENVIYDNVMIKRIDALKRSIHRFMRRLKPGDSLCLIQFNETVRLSQNWTADTALIGIALDRLVADGNTAFYQAVIQGCRKLATHARANKALVAITDGLDNDSTTSTSDVFREIRAANVPVFLMALGFTGTPDEVAAIDTMRQFVAAAPSGKVYQITTGKELEDVYTQIAENFAKDDCCKLYFRIPPCDRGQSKRIVRLIYADGGRIISKELEVDCALKTTSVHTDDVVAPDADVLRASPTPSDDIAAVTMAFSRAGTVYTNLYALDGTPLQHIDHGHVDMGVTQLSIPTASLSAGAYVCRIVQGTDIRTVRIIVQR